MPSSWARSVKRFITPGMTLGALSPDLLVSTLRGRLGEAAT